MESFVWANWPAPPQVRARASARICGVKGDAGAGALQAHALARARFGGISAAPYDSFNLAARQCLSDFKPQALHGDISAVPCDSFNLSVRQCHFKPQALHACSLSFKHPVSGKLQRHRSRLPEDFSLLLSCLRKRSRNGGDA